MLSETNTQGLTNTSAPANWPNKAQQVAWNARVAMQGRAAATASTRAAPRPVQPPMASASALELATSSQPARAMVPRADTPGAAGLEIPVVGSRPAVPRRASISALPQATRPSIRAQWG